MKPPKELRFHRYHWVRERARVECWEWSVDAWWIAGCDESRSPEEAAEWGWEYGEPAISAQPAVSHRGRFRSFVVGRDYMVEECNEEDLTLADLEVKRLRWWLQHIFNARGSNTTDLREMAYHALEGDPAGPEA